VKCQNVFVIVLIFGQSMKLPMILSIHDLRNNHFKGTKNRCM